MSPGPRLALAAGALVATTLAAAALSARAAAQPPPPPADPGPASPAEAAPGPPLPIALGEGSADGDALGVAVRRVGDIDGDGVPDFAVGAPRDDIDIDGDGDGDSDGDGDGDDNGIDAGSVWVYSGRSGELRLLLRGTAAHQRFGYSVADAGDVNADGYGDLIVGAPHEHHRAEPAAYERAGSAHVFSGRDGALLHTIRGRGTGAALGWSVAGAGDIDRDGFDDVLAGAPFYAPQGGAGVGMVLVCSGRTGEVLHTLLGERPGDRFGWSLCRLGDVDRDRVPDFAVGVEGDVEKQAAVRAKAGAARATRAGSVESRSRRAARGKRQAGAALLFSGRKGELLRTLRSGQDNDYFGAAVANAGDFDGDGCDEVVVGGWNAQNAAGVRAGIAVVFSSRTGKELLRLAGDREYDRFGAAVAGLGDIDGDGRPDLAVGAPQDPSVDTGYAQLFSGASGALLLTLRGEQVGDAFGTSLDRAEDRSGDRIADVLVGAPGFRRRGAWLLLPSVVAWAAGVPDQPGKRP
jgi:hypothetical protein